MGRDLTEPMSILDPFGEVSLTNQQPLLASEKLSDTTTTPHDAEGPGSSLDSSEQAFLG